MRTALEEVPLLLPRHGAQPTQSQPRAVSSNHLHIASRQSPPSPSNARVGRHGTFASLHRASTSAMALKSASYFTFLAARNS